jgi:alcohol dehydrogenase (NADP+)
MVLSRLNEQAYDDDTKKKQTNRSTNAMHKSTYNSKAYSAASATSALASTAIKRREPTDRDVQIEILFCGICHSDLHSVRNEWSEFMTTTYPIVPGHEIVGRVTKVGSAVAKYKPGDPAAVGCMVDSDGTCPQCKAGLEQFCPNMILTFNSPDKHLGGVTYGGYPSALQRSHWASRHLA